MKRGQSLVVSLHLLWANVIVKNILLLDIGPNQGHPIAVTADRTTYMITHINFTTRDVLAVERSQIQSTPYTAFYTADIVQLLRQQH